MKIIGITGGVGSGKSTVSKLLEEKYDAFIIYTDKIAHELMEKGNISYRLIVEYFGKGILNAEEEIDRLQLGKQVYQYPEQLQKLNSFTHPFVMDYVAKLIEDKRKEGVKLLCIETALPKEAGLKEICDEIWYVYASEKIRMTRLMESRGYSADKIISIIKRQSSEDEFQELSSHRIKNDGSMESLEEQIEVLLVK